MAIWKKFSGREKTKQNKSDKPTHETSDFQSTLISLRTLPKHIPIRELKPMFASFNFYDKFWFPQGKGIKHKYSIKKVGEDSLIIDGATGLMWQQEGSPGWLTIEHAKSWIKGLNKNSFGGFNDWRLPTLEEAMSLIDIKGKDDRFIDSRFSPVQRTIWTADTGDSHKNFRVNFIDGHHLESSFGQSWVRTVRSI